MHHIRYITITATFLLLINSAVVAVVLNVPAEYDNIRQAIIYSGSGDTIMLASGTYTGSENTDLELGGFAITITSIKGPSATVIDCRGQQNSPHRGFKIHQHEGNTTIIEGIAVVNGYAPADLPGGSQVGGAVLVAGGSSPIFKNCIFRHSFAANGGGGVGVLNASAPIFIDCIFENNWAGEPLYYNYDAGYGGGLLCNLSTPQFSDCRFISNNANYGGGLSAAYSAFSLDNCEFSNNTSRGWGGFEPEYPGYGGGMHLEESNVAISASLFYNNLASAEISVNLLPGQGGGIAAFSSTLQVDNSTFADNTAGQAFDGFSGQGGAIYCTSTNLALHASILAFSIESDACFFFDPSSTKVATLEIDCSDIYGNDAGDWVGALTGMEVSNGNFSDDPSFCMGVDDIYNIETISPCAPDNNTCNILIGYGAVGCITDVNDSDGPAGITFELKQNHPNPFNLATTIEYAVSSPGRIVIDIFNVTGQKVRGLIDRYQFPGDYAVNWDGRDERGGLVSSGIYFYRIESGIFNSARKMILMK